MARTTKILSKSFTKGEIILIFVTVGTQKFQFERLLNKVEKIINEQLIDEVFLVQCGYNDLLLNCECKDFFEPIEVENIIKKSDLVITHAGTSSIIQALKYEKKVIVVPRLSKYGEHVDDHQVEIAELFANKNYVELVRDIDDLEDAINLITEKEYEKYDFENNGIKESIESFLSTL